jgi:uncharacterized membrane protein
MNVLLTIVAMAAVTFACRFVGLLGLPARNTRTMSAIGLVPAAVFAALVSGGLEFRPDTWLRWLAVASGGLASWKDAPLWVSVGLGLAVYFGGTALLN